MYTAQKIDYVGQQIRYDRYLKALRLWNDTSKKNKKIILSKMGFDPILSNRAFPFLPKFQRDDLVELFND